MTHPAYGSLRTVTATARVLLQHNPGPMTLDGTNTWLIGSKDRVVLVDPGQREPADHVDTLLAAVLRVDLVLLTHGHHDHSDLAAAVHERTGAPVRALDPAHCHGGDPLAGGEVIDAAGMRLEVLATPGHTSDSVSFVLDDAVLTGDTVLGRGTTVVAHPDGNLAAYLDSLKALQSLGDRTVLPGHGPELPAIADVAAMYLTHRAERLEQVRAALAALGPDATARQVVEVVYADVDRSVWWAAELSVEAQLDYLRT